MGQSVNKRQQRQALVNAEKHLGRIAAALESIARSLHPQLADDDGPDPVEAKVLELLRTTGHGLCLPWSWDPTTGSVACSDEGHVAPVVVGTVKSDG